MTPAEIRKIAAFDDSLMDGASIGFARSDDPRSAEMAGFLEELVRHAPKIKVSNRDAGEDGIPALHVGKGLVFRMIPDTAKLDAFLASLAPDSAAPPPEVQEALDRPAGPVSLRLFVAPGCPHCPGALSSLISAKKASDKVLLTVEDAALFPETAALFNIRSVPTLIVGESIRFSGAFDIADVAGAMAAQDPAQLPPAVLEQMLSDGMAGELAGMMLQAETVFPALFPLLSHEKWPPRLGAMVTAETVIDAAPALAAAFVEPLKERFADAPDTVKGDILYILGRTSHPSAVEFIRTILSGDYAKAVREAAEDALKEPEPT